MIEKLRKLWSYGSLFWSAAFFSLAVLVAVWIEALLGHGEIKGLALKWVMTPLSSPKGLVEIPDVVGISIPLSPFILLITFYVITNLWTRKKNDDYREKPGEVIVFLYTLSFGLMFVLSYFSAVQPPVEFWKLWLNLMLLVHVPSQIIKYALFGKNGGKNENNKTENPKDKASAQQN